MSKRRKLDFYETGLHAVEALLARVSLGPSVLEPCVGRRAIATPLLERNFHVFMGDLDPEFDPGRMARDACWWLSDNADASGVVRPKLPVGVDVATNPPFNEANRIVPAFVRAGHRCAFLLRLSWLEPTEDRQEFLVEHPPSGIIVLPRYSFRGDGKTDSVTAAWMLWGFRVGPAIQVVRKPGGDR